jgi:hypothetical protein
MRIRSESRSTRVQCAGLRPMRGAHRGEDRGDHLVAQGEQGGDGVRSQGFFLAFGPEVDPVAATHAVRE